MKQLSTKSRRILAGIGLFLVFCLIVGATSEKPEHIKKLFAQTKASDDTEVTIHEETIPEDKGENDKKEDKETKKLELVKAEKRDKGYVKHIVGTLKNNTDRTYSYVRVTFNLYNESGAQVGTAVDSVRNLEAGGTWKFETFTLGKDFATFEVSDITAY